VRFYKDPKPLVEMSEQEMAEFHIEAMGNFHYFNEVVLGHHDMNQEHKALCEFWQSYNRQYLLALLPRYTFKSSVLTIGDSLWWMYKNPNIRILIYSDSAGKAGGFLQGIKNHIEGKAANSRFRELIGKLETDAHKGKWNESQIIISKRTESRVEPTVDTAGIETSKVGMHYDRIYFDDIVSDVNVTTKAQMDKVYECYQKSLSLLTPIGDVRITGTRWHFGDTYGRLIKENEETDQFGLFVRSAEELNKDGKLLFEDSYLTREFLDQKKAQQGSYIYSCLYKNSPVDDEQAIFKQDDFEFYGRLREASNPHKTGLYEDLYVTCTLDPSGEGSDPTGGTVVGTDHDMKMYILETFNRNCLPDQMINWVIAMNIKYRIKLFGIETTFFRGMLKREFDERIKEAQRENPGFHLFGIREFKPSAKRGESKFARILALQPFHQRRDICFPGKNIETQKTGFSDLAYQMLQLTPNHMPEPNDLLDSLAYHVDLIQRGGMVKKAGPPKNSPADLERQWIERFNLKQKRLPRRLRRTWVPSFQT